MNPAPREDKTMINPPPTSALGTMGQSRRPLLLIRGSAEPTKRLLEAVQESKKLGYYVEGKKRGYYIADDLPLEVGGTLSQTSLGLLQAHRASLEVAQGGLLVPAWSQLPQITKELISIAASPRGLEGIRRSRGADPGTDGPGELLGELWIFRFDYGQMSLASPVKSGFEARRFEELSEAADINHLDRIFDVPAGRRYGDAKDKLRELRAAGAGLEEVRTYLEAFGYENKHRNGGSWGRAHLDEIWDETDV